MSTSPFLDAAIPLPAPPEARYIWATVTQVDPLRIQVDGDQTPLGITPDCLVADLDVGRRVYCQIVNRRLVVLGVSGGVPTVGGDTYLVGEPVGSIHFTVALTTDPAPDGCLWLDGGTASRTTYPELFALWTTRFGAGDGSTTFGLPDMRGRVPVGNKSSGVFNLTPGTVVGSETHAHGTSQLIAGLWVGFWKSRAGATWTATNSGGVTAPGGSSSTSSSGPSIEGNTDAASTVQPSLVGRWYVRATNLTLAPTGSTAATPATPDTVVLRDSAGRTQVSTPVVALDVANKQYVDTKYPRVCVPSSIAVTGGGSATVAADGTINFSGVSSLSLDGVFDGQGMDTYEVTVYATTSTGTYANYRLRASGVDTASGYNRVATYSTSAAGPTRASVFGTTDTCIMTPSNLGGSAGFNGRTTFQNPGRSTLTIMQHRAWAAINGDRYMWDEVGDGAGTAHDGLTLLTSAGTLTGSIFVRKIA